MAPVQNDSYSVSASCSSFSSSSASEVTRNSQSKKDSKDSWGKFLPIASRGGFFQDSFFENSRSFFDEAIRRFSDEWDETDITTDAWFKTPSTRSDHFERYRQLRSDRQRQEDRVFVDTSDDGDLKIVVDVHEFVCGDIRVKVVGEKEVSVEGHMDEEEKKKKKEEKEEAGVGYKPLRQFHYLFSLPEDINMDAITSAMSSDGILTISAPKMISGNRVNSTTLMESTEHRNASKYRTSRPSAKSNNISGKSAITSETVTFDCSGNSSVRNGKEVNGDFCENCGHISQEQMKASQTNSLLNGIEKKKTHVNNSSFTESNLMAGMEEIKQEINTETSESKSCNVQSEGFKRVSHSEDFRKFKMTGINDERDWDKSESIEDFSRPSTSSYMNSLPIRRRGLASHDSFFEDLRKEFYVDVRDLFFKRDERRMGDDLFFKRDKRSTKENEDDLSSKRDERSTMEDEVDLQCKRHLRTSEIRRRKEVKVIKSVEDQNSYMFILDVQDFLHEGEIVIKAKGKRELVIECQMQESEGVSNPTKSFIKRFDLPKDVDLNAAQSSMSSDGLLIIIVPKKIQMRQPNEFIVPITLENSVDEIRNLEKSLEMEIGNNGESFIQSSAINKDSAVDAKIVESNKSRDSSNVARSVSSLQSHQSNIHQCQSSSQTLNEETIQVENEEIKKSLGNKDTNQYRNINHMATTDQELREKKIEINAEVVKDVQQKEQTTNEDIEQLSNLEQQRLDKSYQVTEERFTQNKETEKKECSGRLLDKLEVSSKVDNSFEMSQVFTNIKDEEETVSDTLETSPQVFNSIQTSEFSENTKEEEKYVAEVKTSFQVFDSSEMSNVSTNVKKEENIILDKYETSSQEFESLGISQDSTIVKEEEEIISEKLDASKVSDSTEMSQVALKDNKEEEIFSDILEVSSQVFDSLEVSQVSAEEEKDVVSDKLEVSQEFNLREATQVSVNDKEEMVSEELEDSSQVIDSIEISQVSINAKEEKEEEEEIKHFPAEVKESCIPESNVSISLPVEEKGLFFEDLYFKDMQNPLLEAIREILLKNGDLSSPGDELTSYRNLITRDLPEENQTTISFEDQYHYKFILDVSDIINKGEIRVKFVNEKEIMVESQVQEKERNSQSIKNFSKCFTLVGESCIESASSAISSDGFLAIIIPKKISSANTSTASEENENIKQTFVQLPECEPQAKAKAMEVKAKAMEVKAKEMVVKAKTMDVKAKEMMVKAKEMDVKAKAVKVKAKEMEVKAKAMEVKAESSTTADIKGVDDVSCSSEESCSIAYHAQMNDSFAVGSSLTQENSSVLCSSASLDVHSFSTSEEELKEPSKTIQVENQEERIPIKEPTDQDEDVNNMFNNKGIDEQSIQLNSVVNSIATKQNIFHEERDALELLERSHLELQKDKFFCQENKKNYICRNMIGERDSMEIVDILPATDTSSQVIDTSSQVIDTSSQVIDTSSQVNESFDTLRVSGRIQIDYAAKASSAVDERTDIASSSENSISLSVQERGSFAEDKFFEGMQGHLALAAKEMFSEDRDLSSTEDEMTFYRNLRRQHLLEEQQTVIAFEDGSNWKFIVDVYDFIKYGEIRVKIVKEKGLLFVEGFVDKNNIVDSESIKSFSKCCHLSGDIDINSAVSGISSDGVLAVIIPKKTILLQDNETSCIIPASNTEKDTLEMCEEFRQSNLQKEKKTESTVTTETGNVERSKLACATFTSSLINEQMVDMSLIQNSSATLCSSLSSSDINISTSEKQSQEAKLRELVGSTKKEEEEEEEEEEDEIKIENGHQTTENGRQQTHEKSLNIEKLSTVTAETDDGGDANDYNDDDDDDDDDDVDDVQNEKDDGISSSSRINERLEDLSSSVITSSMKNTSVMTSSVLNSSATNYSSQSSNINYKFTMAESPQDQSNGFITFGKINEKGKESSYEASETSHQMAEEDDGFRAASTLSIHTVDGSVYGSVDDNVVGIVDDRDVDDSNSLLSSVGGISSYSSVEDRSLMHENSSHLFGLSDSSKTHRNHVSSEQTHSEEAELISSQLDVLKEGLRSERRKLQENNDNILGMNLKYNITRPDSVNNTQDVQETNAQSMKSEGCASFHKVIHDDVSLTRNSSIANQQSQSNQSASQSALESHSNYSRNNKMQKSIQQSETTSSSSSYTCSSRYQSH